MAIVTAMAAFLGCACGALAQSTSFIAAGPNTIGFYNYNLRTASQNGTNMIVPLPRQAVAAAVPYPLIDCTNDNTLFPHGFPEGSFPVRVTTGVQNDIRMGELEIDSLMAGQIYVPCVDRLGDGKTLFQYAISSYIGGTNGQALMAYVPALVGGLETTPITTAKVYPDYLAYRQVGPNQFSSQVKQLVAANSASGPGVVPPAFDLIWSNTASNQYSAHTFHSILNQPIIGPVGGTLCFRNTVYFNDTFANTAFTSGEITIYNVTGVQPASFVGRYSNVGGYSGNQQVIGYEPQTCASAAADNDPFASQ